MANWLDFLKKVVQNRQSFFRRAMRAGMPASRLAPTILRNTILKVFLAGVAGGVIGGGLVATQQLTGLTFAPQGGIFDLVVGGNYEVEKNPDKFSARQYLFRSPGHVTQGEDIYLEIDPQTVGGRASVGPPEKPLEGFTSLGEYRTLDPLKTHNPARFILKIKNNSGQPTSLTLDEIKNSVSSQYWTVDFVQVIPEEDKREIINRGANLGTLAPEETMTLEVFVMVGARLGLEDRFYRERLRAMVQQVLKWQELWEEALKDKKPVEYDRVSPPPPSAKITGDYQYPRLSFFNDERNTVGLAVFPSILRKTLSGSSQTSIHFDILIEDFYPGGISKRPNILYDQGQLITRAVPSLYATRQILTGMNLVKFTKLHDIFYDVPEESMRLGPEPPRTFYSTKCGLPELTNQTAVETTRLMRLPSDSPKITLELAQELKVALDAAFGVELEIEKIEVTDPNSPVYFDGGTIVVRYYQSRNEMCGFTLEYNKDPRLSPLQTVSGYTAGVIGSVIFDLFPKLREGQIKPGDWEKYQNWEEWKKEYGMPSAFGTKRFYMAGPIGLDLSQYDYYDRQAIGQAWSAGITMLASKALQGANYGARYQSELETFHGKIEEISQEAEEEKTLEVLGVLAWPVDSRFITVYFRQLYIFGIHTGLDVATDQGDPVYAAEDGEVVLVEDQDYRVSLLPSRVVIKHANGLVTVYLHMSRIKVKEGDKVKRGEVIGAAGGTPGTSGAGFFSTGPHIHFEVWEDGELRDPLEYLDTRGLAYSGYKPIYTNVYNFLDQLNQFWDWGAKVFAAPFVR